MPPCSELYQPKRKEVLIKQAKCINCLGGWVRLTSFLDAFNTRGDIFPQTTMITRLDLVVADKEAKGSRLDWAAAPYCLQQTGLVVPTTWPPETSPTK